MPRPRILVTGFAPFAGLAVNPSGEIVRALERAGPAAADLVGRVLPVSFGAVPGLVRDLIAEHRPHAVLGLGVAIGAPVIRVETTALNRAGSRVADADGALADGVLEPDGAAARTATYPAEAVLRAIRRAGVPAALSHHAGTHLCNLALYHCLGALDARAPCGFLHVPLMPEQVAALQERSAGAAATAPFAPTDLPSMALELQLRAVAAALAILAAAAARV